MLPSDHLIIIQDFHCEVGVVAVDTNPDDDVASPAIVTSFTLNVDPAAVGPVSVYAAGWGDNVGGGVNTAFFLEKKNRNKLRGLSVEGEGLYNATISHPYHLANRVDSGCVFCYFVASIFQLNSPSP